MDLPLGKRNGPGSPKNAVKGALNWQGVKHPIINLIDVGIAAELNNRVHPEFFSKMSKKKLHIR